MFSRQAFAIFITAWQSFVVRPSKVVDVFNLPCAWPSIEMESNAFNGAHEQTDAADGSTDEKAPQSGHKTSRTVPICET